MDAIYSMRQERESLYQASSPTMSQSVPPDQWGDPEDLCLPRFPIDLLPPVWADFVAQVAASVHAPVDFAAAAFLGTLSAALTGRVYVRIKGGFEKPVQLYLGLIGASGSGKSPVMKIISRPLSAWLTRQRQSVKEANIANGVDGQPPLPAPEALVSDVTPEALLQCIARQGGKGIIFAEEGSIANILSGATYGSKGSQTNIDIFLNAYDGSGVYSARVGRDEPIDLPSAHLSITLALQPRLVDSFAKDPNLDDRGLPQRFLFFLAEPLGQYSVYDEPELSTEMLTMWHDTVEKLASAYRETDLTLSLSYEARQEYLAFRQCMVNRASEDLGEGSALASWSGKSHEKAARLSGLLTMLRDVHAAEIQLEEMRAACRMMNEYFIPHIKAVFGHKTALSPEASAVLKAAKAIAASQAGPIRESALRHKLSRTMLFKGDNSAQLLQQALAQLIKKRFIRPVELPRATTGRPSLGAYELNPALLEER